VDQYGNAYVTGYTSSTDFPSTLGVLQYYFTPPGSTTTNLEDGFVIKMNQVGDAYAYATLLGGTASNTIATGIAVDASGHAFVTGTTDPGFPTTAAAFQTTDQAGANQAFFSELDPIGASLLYSTFLAGTAGEAYDTEPSATGVSYLATDASGNAYVTGQTDSTNFPTTPGAFQTNSHIAGGSQPPAVTGFVAKFVFVDSALSISPTTLSAGTAGVPYGPVTLTTAGGTGTATFAETAGSLPPNLTLSSAGVLSGTPTQRNTFSFTITATDSIGDTNSQTYSLQIGCPTIIVGPSTLANGTTGTAYPVVTFTETGGVGTTAFSESGALPTGMTFLAGVLSGTPTQTGRFPITVTATDSNGCIGTASPTLTINSPTGPPANITATAGTPQGTTINTAFATALQATVTDSSGNLLSAVSVTFTAPASGASGTFANGSATYATTTNASGVATATTFTANGTAGAYIVTAAVSGVATAANFSLTNNSATGPPPTVMDNETITVSDTVSFPDVFDSELISVADTVKVTACEVIRVTPSSSLPAATVGSPYSQLFTTAEAGTFAWSTSGNVPPGLTMNSTTGVLSGTPTAASAFSFTVTATDQTGCSSSVNVSLTVNPAPTGTTTTTITSTSSTFGGLSLPANLSLVGGKVTVGFAVKPTSGTATPTGSVSVIDGLGDNCGPATLANSAGSCALTISQAPPSGSASLVATYTPDTNSSSLLTSTSSPFMESIVHVSGCGPLPAAQSSGPGKTVTFTFSACVATDILTSPTALVSGCPPGAQCTATISPAPNNPFVFNIVVTIVLGSSATTVPIREPRLWGEPWPMTFFWLGMLLAILMAIQMARQNQARPRLLYAAGFLLALVLSGVSGCTSASLTGGGNGTSPTTYTININVTDGGFSATVPLTLTVTK
jgi:hypothetical protein